MNFKELDRLRLEVASLRARHVESLTFYHIKGGEGGFRHKYTAKDQQKVSKASTATCILSLTAAGLWTKDQDDWYSQSTQLAQKMLLDEWKSSDLPLNNPFTVSFVLEAATLLQEADAVDELDDVCLTRAEAAEKVLAESLREERESYPNSVGAAAITDYPPSAYVTQLVVRVLKKRKKFNDELKTLVKTWSWREMVHELALAYSGSKSADAYSLAYLVMVFIECTNAADLSPDEKHLVKCAVDVVFAAQLPDGSWPRSKPLFHYPKYGNAYCYEYEMLAQFLQHKELQQYFLEYLEKLSKSVRRLSDTSYQLTEKGGLGWASGHHPQEPGPESWSTASVYHFLHEFDRLLAEAVRKTVFAYVGTEYKAPGPPAMDDAAFRQNFLDASLVINGEPQSLTEVLLDKFVKPIAAEARKVELGRDLPKKVSISAIFFGPPGTSKTQLAKKVAQYLNWPLLSLDPSHLVRRGQDKIQAETNILFSMLSALERVVVFLDEFDEMVRERTEQDTEASSRFLTTAMLPKLSQIADRRRIVFILATNHINRFDFAIRRPGRFDLLVQIMPPTLEAKKVNWPRFATMAKRWKLDTAPEEVRKALTELTYLEFDELTKSLEGVSDAQKAQAVILKAHARGTLSQKVYQPEKNGLVSWSEVSKEQSGQSRVRGM